MKKIIITTIIDIIQKIARIIYELLTGFLCICGITLLIVLHASEKLTSISITDIITLIQQLWFIFLVLYSFINFYRYIIKDMKERAIENPISKITSNEVLIKLQKLAATHEAGHIIMCYLCGKELLSAMITENGNGNTSYANTAYPNIEDLRYNILIGYAGAAAEEILLGSISRGPTGAENADYERNTQYIRQYYILTNPAAPKIISDALTAEYIGPMAVEFYEECKDLLSRNKESVEAVSIKLYEQGRLSKKDVEKLLSEHPLNK